VLTDTSQLAIDT